MPILVFRPSRTYHIYSPCSHVSLHKQSSCVLVCLWPWYVTTCNVLLYERLTCFQDGICNGVQQDHIHTTCIDSLMKNSQLIHMEEVDPALLEIPSRQESKPPYVLETAFEGSAIANKGAWEAFNDFVAIHRDEYSDTSDFECTYETGINVVKYGGITGRKNLKLRGSCVQSSDIRKASDRAHPYGTRKMSWSCWKGKLRRCLGKRLLSVPRTLRKQIAQKSILRTFYQFTMMFGTRSWRQKMAKVACNDIVVGVLQYFLGFLQIGPDKKAKELKNNGLIAYSVHILFQNM